MGFCVSDLHTHCVRVTTPIRKGAITGGIILFKPRQEKTLVSVRIIAALVFNDGGRYRSKKDESFPLMEKTVSYNANLSPPRIGLWSERTALQAS